MLELSFLGKLRIANNGEDLTDRLPRKVAALLCYLVVTGETQDRLKLAGLLWPDVPDSKALNSLRVALTALRKHLAGHFDVTHQTLAFQSASNHWLDITAFELALEDGDWQAALNLYRGDFLSDQLVEKAPDYNEWMLAQRAYWREMALEQFGKLAEDLLNRREYIDALAVFQKRLWLEPWDEASHRAIMECHCRLREFNAALAQYEQCCDRLASELGVEPMPETRALYERILLARHTQPIYTADGKLPIFGREQETAVIQERLADPGCRLITITGLGGTGKTHLALVAARQVSQEQSLQFINGVAVVPLGGVATSEALPGTILHALDGEVTGRTSSDEALIRFLSRRETLLVLDNFEHLTDGVDLISRILDSCPDVKLMVTSREPLRLATEWRIRLEGLDYPTDDRDLPDRLDQYSAIQLFLDTARQVQPMFRLTSENTQDVVRLCRMVGGLPLALQLAARWLRAMSIDQIATRVTESMDILTTGLRDIPDRQRSLRIIYDDTVAQLEPAERHSLHALSIFQGGCTADAAGQIAEASPMVLAELADRGLVTITDEGRYHMHELTRHYAAEARSDVIAEQHAEYFAELLQASHADFHGPRQSTILIELVKDIDNIRRAWQYAITHNRTDLLSAMVESLAAMYAAQPWLAEGGQPLHAALSVLSTDNTESLALSAAIAQYLAAIQYTQGDMNGRRSARMALEQATRAHAPQLTAWAHVRLGLFDVMGGAFDEALAHAYQAMTDFIDLDDQHGRVEAMNVLGAVHDFQGQHDEAAHWYHSAIELAQAAGDTRSMLRPLINAVTHDIDAGRFIEAQTLLLDLEQHATMAGYARYQGLAAITLGRTYEALGDFEQAHDYYLRGHTICLQQADRYHTAIALRWLSRAKRFLGDLAGSMRCAREAYQTLRQIAPRSAPLGLIEQGETALAMGNRDDARRYFRETVALAREANIADDILTSAGSLAEMAVEEGDLDTARQWLEEAVQIEASVKRLFLKYQFLTHCAFYHLASGALQQALLLLAYVRTHPNAHIETRRLAQERWEEHQGGLSPDEHDLILAKASHLTLEAGMEYCLKSEMP